MKGLLRRLRGIIGTGITWALGWAGLYVLSILVKAAFGVEIRGDLLWLLPGVLKAGAWGFVGGSGFGALVSIVERYKRIEDLSLWRFALWGGIGGLALAVTLGPVYLSPVIFFTVLGVGSATGTVALAKRGSGQALIEGDDEQMPALEGE